MGIITRPVLALALALSLGSGAEASEGSDFLIFPALEGSATSRDPKHRDRSTEIDTDPEIDLFYASARGDLRFLGELFLDRSEQELERLQLGWAFTDAFTAWLGRGHNFLGYWNTQYHHGAFLETAISRPRITEYEDDDGILPQHVTGLFTDLRYPLGKALTSYELAFGVGPELADDGLDTYDLLKPKDGSHDLNLTLRLSYQPLALAPDVLGVFAGATRIPSDTTRFRELDQYQLGGFFNWEPGPLRLLGAVFYVRNDVDARGGHFDADIVSGYIQGERALNPGWSLYARLEQTGGDRGRLQKLFPRGMANARLGGLRYELGANQALKLELSRTRGPTQTDTGLRIQWSAVFP